MQDDAVLAALLSSPSVVLVAAGLDGMITRWSVGAAALYGWTEDEIVGQHLQVLVPEERREELLICERLLSDAAAHPLFETQRLAKDGTRIPVDLHVSLLRDELGQPVGHISLHRDLRRAERAETALLASAEELRLAFSESPVPQARVDLQGAVLAVNAAMEKLCGEPASRLVGREALLMYLDADRPVLEAALRRLATGEQAYVQQERTLALGDGRHVPVLMTATVIPAPDGSPLIAASLEDVSELVEAQERARVSAERFEALVAGLPVAVFTYDLAGRCTSSRGRGLKELGLVEDEVVGTLLLESYAYDPVVQECLVRTLAGEEAAAVVDLNGRILDCYYRPLFDVSGALTGGIGVALDITERAAAERAVRANEARMQALLRNAGDIVWVVDLQSRLLWVSPAVQAVLGWEPRSLLWRPTAGLVHPEDLPGVTEAWQQALQGAHGGGRRSCRLRRADGTLGWFDYSFTDLMDDPAVGGIVVNLRDVTERRNAERELQRLALLDPMTGLANRAFLLDRVGRAMDRAAKQERSVGLVLLGVARMGQINETFGEEVGDVVLCSVAGRLLEFVRGTDSVARSGGDQFAVLLEDIASEEELRARAAALVDDLQGALDLGDVSVDLQMRVGRAMTPAADAGSLLAAAERSYGSGRAGVLVASTAFEPSEGREGQAVAELRRALARGELRMHFQPVMNLVTDELTGVEALVRWEHPERGLLPPSEFIPLAESSGLIVDVGEWALREACRHAAHWQRAGRHFRVGINLSPRQMVGPELVDLVRRVVQDTGVRPDRVVLEVTESAVIDEPDAADLLRDLRTLGIKLALDDFGTGYSSLTYLRRFPIDAIKIDRSFVAGLGRHSDDDAIVASIVSLGRAIGKIMVAEGVETRAQLSALREMGVDQAQGFLWSRGLPPEQLLGWLDSYERRPAPLASPVPALTAAPAPAPRRSAEAPAEDAQAIRRILQLHSDGASLHTIAAAVNAEGLRTAAGPRWTTTTVARVIASQPRP